MMKRRIIAMTLISTILGIFGCKKSSPEYEVDENYKDLREQVFSLDPKDVGLKQSEGSNPVWGVLMETGYPEAVFSLLAIADGTVSIYFSNGGGIIGLGQHDEPNRVASEFLQMTNTFLSNFQLTTETALPVPEMTRFYIFTFDGILMAEAKEDEFGNNRHNISPLFHKGHELITAIRIIDEKQRSDKSDVR